MVYDLQKKLKNLLQKNLPDTTGMHIMEDLANTIASLNSLN